MASVTHAKVSGAGPAPSPDLVGGDDWDAAHVLDLSSITGTAGGAAAAGGAIAISGGTGDSGNDAGASITVGGGTGTGTAGVVTVTGEVLGSASVIVRGAAQSTEVGASLTAGAGQSATRGGNAFLSGGDAGAGVPGGSATLQGGYGDDGGNIQSGIQAEVIG